jgi:hypothetical protein
MDENKLVDEMIEYLRVKFFENQVKRAFGDNSKLKNYQIHIPKNFMKAYLSGGNT